MHRGLLSLCGFLMLYPLRPAEGIDPQEVFVVANKNMPGSQAVAEHYLAKRSVPKTNLLMLDLPTTEDISRADYDRKLATPLREALQDRKTQIKVLLTVYGVPLRVGGQLPTPGEKEETDRLKREVEEVKKKIAELEKDKAPQADVAVAKLKLDGMEKRIRTLSYAQSRASVDSELMCLWWPSYPLDRWVMNPLYFRASANYRQKAPPVLLTARLDGPSPEIAKRLVDDAVAVEAKGLDGLIVIDARGFRFDPKGKDVGTGYDGYDESMRETASLFEKAGCQVRLDNKAAVLPEGASKGVAIYCGWYSHAKFVDCCEYVPGAVAWHLASSEAVTLRKPESTVWCPNLLKKGVAATIGPVAEPYTVGFPKPAEFFGFLATGEFTLVECYAKTQLFASWMCVLVGDPLYNPFKKNPKLKSTDVVASPRGGVNPAP